ncbi:MAG: M48 family metalloprotease [Magnetococcales bacterium]|nr:M48 family metalloprotease [Magnetococcales bacterium]
MRIFFVFFVFTLLIGQLPLPVESRSNKDPRQNTIRLVTDPETLDLLKQIGNPILNAANLSPDRVQFHVVLDSQINAFALLGNKIIFNSGLLLAVDKADEFAGVMAHEVAHLTAGHHIQLQSEAESLSIKTLITIAAGIAAGLASQNEDLAMAIYTGGQAAAKSAILESIRQKETQADRMAIRYLAKAGYAPEGLPGFLEKIEQANRLVNQPAPYLITHPITDQRILESREIASTLPRHFKKHPIDDIALQRVRLKLIAGTTTDPNRIAALWQEKLKNPDLTTDQKAILAYGIALAFRYAGLLPESIRILDQLDTEWPNDAYLLRERGLTHLENGNTQQAINNLNAALTQKPNHPDLRYHLAFAHKESNNLETAANLLRKITVENPEQARAFYMLGVVEGQRKKMGQSHLALARYNKRIAQPQSAIWHYKQALLQFGTGSIEFPIIQSEMKRLKEPLKAK